MYVIGIFICLALGYLLVRFLVQERLSLPLHLLLALSLGLGINGSIAFYIHILLDQFNRFIPVGISLLIIAIAVVRFFTKKKPAPAQSSKKLKGQTLPKRFKWNPANNWGLILLGLLAVPLALTAHCFPLGGWDAWSCWNLKAKFIFLGHENWREVLTPDFWRSNTQYPLLWPLINVWFWDLGGGFDQAVPMLNSIVIALLTAGTLLFGLLELTGLLLPSMLAAIVVTALPFGVTLNISQYSDSLLGLYLLSAFVCVFLAEKYDLPQLKILSVIFLGLMSFSKSEGLVACVIATLLIFWHQLPKKNGFPTKLLGNDNGKLLWWIFIAALPTIIFTFFIAPKNEAFINGLTSAQRPITWQRLEVVALYPFRFEFISGHWNGFWLMALAGIILAGKKLWQSTLGIIGLTLILYLGVVMAYYAVNTFFDIGWWMSNTLSRILFALVPTLVLWIGLGLEG